MFSVETDIPEFPPSHEGVSGLSELVNGASKQSERSTIERAVQAKECSERVSGPSKMRSSCVETRPYNM